jgi:hypothetical protein
VDVVKGLNTFLVLLLAAMAFATNSVLTLDMSPARITDGKEAFFNGDLM